MDKFKERYEKLNEEQKKAVDTIEGPVLVVAGPGSGKTEILGLRVANILKKIDTNPGNILCATFSDAAAVNLRKRLLELIGHDAHKVAVHTFHNFGVAIRQQYPEFFYGGDMLSASDETLQRETIEAILDDLPHSHPLSKKSPEQGYVYLRPAKNAISNLKKAGITPEEFKTILEHDNKFIEFANPLVHDVFDSRISKETIKAAGELAAKLESFEEDPFPIAHMPGLKSAVVASLNQAVSEASEENKTAPLSQWKTDRLKKDEATKKRVLKEGAYSEKMFALADLYREYQDRMREAGYYDFDDMIMEAIQKVEHNETLRAELRERYQYILVDEFQDTNDAQMRLLYLLMDSPVNEGKPNIMAVGDDDQAIYKFQGAEISNIHNFKKEFPEASLVMLKKNYRSRQDILDLATKIIKKGEDRLENIIPEIQKDLVQANENLKDGVIEHKSFASRDHEHFYVAGEIEKMLGSGKDPSDIVVIARDHDTLKDVSKFLNQKQIPYRYKRRDNVLEQQHIRQIICMMRFISSLAKGDSDDAEWYLPEILQYPFWNVDRREVWEMSVRARRSGKPWLELMLEHKNVEFKKIANFFIQVAGDARIEPFEYIVDKLVGTRPVHFSEGPAQQEEIIKNEFSSPFKEFYFSKQKLENSKAEYLTFLSNLKVFIDALRGHKKAALLHVEDILDLIRFHEDNDIPISDTSPFVGAENAVDLLTAHDAKGREFDTVFVLGSVSEIWARKNSGSLLPFPANLSISPAGDTLDDKIRLFFVAITRAEHNLYITSHRLKSNGKETTPLEFVEETPEEATEEEVRTPEVLVNLWEAETLPPFTKDEESYLRTLVENYQMSVTHLNNFLDVTEGGPKKFMEQNLLRFPQTKSPALSFGTAMHAAVEYLYNRFKQDGTPPLKDVQDLFREVLAKERLSDSDYKKQEERGIDALEAYYKEKSGSLDPSALIEVNFKHEGVALGDARLGGKIDKITFGDEKEAIVSDFKTGKAEKDWKGASPYGKMKLHRYKLQLAFYKLLVENSNKFNGYTVNNGALEFLEPHKGELVDLELAISDDLADRTERLAQVVYSKILDLDFPDASGYSKDLQGIEQFEDDLLSGKV